MKNEKKFAIGNLEKIIKKLEIAEEFENLEIKSLQDQIEYIKSEISSIKSRLSYMGR